MNQIKRLNYSTQAIESLKSFKDNPDYPAMEKIIELLTNSVKFILPNGADLIEPSDFSEKHFELLKLPFPITAFEFTCIKDNFNPNMTNQSSKRIALAWDKETNQNYFPDIYNSTSLMKQYENQDGIFIISVIFIDSHSKWTVPSCLVFIPYDNVEVTNGLSGSEYAKMLTQVKKGYECRCEPAPILRYFYKSQQRIMNDEMIYGAALADNADEISAVLQACAVINCSNVIFEEYKAPKFQNQSRLKKKKTPLFEYKILAIESEKKVYDSTNTTQHNSPRSHLRRGHIRKLPTGKNIWVRPALINAGKGFIDKEYSVNG